MMTWLLFALLLIVPLQSWAEACTDGVDCFADCIQDTDGAGNNVSSGGKEYANTACRDKYNGSGTPIYTTAVYVEDAEAITLFDDTGAGGSAPAYGPWYDDGAGNSCGSTNNRGANSYIGQRHGSPSDTRLNLGEPGSPTVGCSCDFSICTGIGDYTEDDLWGPGVTNGSELKWPFDFVCEGASCPANNDSFSFEVAGIGTPDSCGVDGVCGNADDVIDLGVWDGMGVWGQRYLAGENCASDCGAGFGGELFQFSPALTSFTMTAMVAYADNFFTSGIQGRCDGHTPDVGCHADSECAGLGTETCTNYGLKDWEYVTNVGRSFQWHSAHYPPDEWGPGLDELHGTTEGACQAACDAATKEVGTSCFCDSLFWNLEATGFDQSASFPIGKWHCVQLKVVGLGATSGGVLRQWINGTQVLGVSNADMSALNQHSQVDFLKPNWFANSNQDPDGNNTGEDPADEATRQWKDNIVYLTGDVEPVTCAEVGYGSVVSGTPGNTISGSGSIADVDDQREMRQPFAGQ